MQFVQIVLWFFKWQASSSVKAHLVLSGKYKLICTHRTAQVVNDCPTAIVLWHRRNKAIDQLQESPANYTICLSFNKAQSVLYNNRTKRNTYWLYSLE